MSYSGKLAQPLQSVESVLYLRWVTKKDLRTAKEPHSELCGSLDGRGVWGRRDACIGMTASLCCPSEAIMTLLISYTPIQNKKFKKNQ